MHPLIYDASLLAGTGLATAGAWQQWGSGVGLMVCGGLVVALTLVTAVLMGPR